MAWTLLLASIDGALVVAAVWILTRTLALTPATRTFLWWCAAAKFVLALAWTTPILVPVLPPATPAAVPATAMVSGRAPTRVAEPPPPTDVGTKLVIRIRERVGPRLVSRFIPAFVLDPSRERSDLALISRLRDLGEWGAFAALAWMAGLFLLVFVAIARWRETVAIVRASAIAGEDTQRQTADLAARLGLKHVPEVRISDRVETPLVAGLHRPVVLLPADRFAALTARHREMALCHELMHLKRADLWLGCVPALAERLFFFHPLAHTMSREYSIAREAACDAAVVESLGAAPREYGALLLALGVSRRQAGAAAGAAWSFLHLKRRIAMLQEFPARSDRSRAVAAAAVGLAVLALLPLRLVARPAQASALAQDRAVLHELESAALREPVETAPGRPAEPIEQDGQERREGSLKFVLFLGGDQQTVSGSPEDLRSAQRQRRGNESMLWFRRDGREFVIRDEEVLRQARAAWRDFNAHELHQLIDSEHFAAMATLGLDSKIFEQAGELGVEAGKLGTEMGQNAMEIAHEALRNLHQDEVQNEKLRERHQLPEAAERANDLQTRRLHESAREMQEQAGELHDRMKRDFELGDFEHSVKQELERHRAELELIKEKINELEGPMRDLAGPMRELAAPMAELGTHAGRLGREIGDYTQRAMEGMREVIERAIASGKAQTVK